jgi:hypothetical protein
MKNWLEYSILELFSNRKCHGLGPWLVDQCQGGRSTGPPWTHGGADRGHGSALTGAWPPASAEHGSSPAGVQQSGEHGEPGGRLTEARVVVWRPGDGEETAAGREVGNRGARALGEGESELGRCGEVRGWCSPFIGAGGGGGRAPGRGIR